MSELLKKQRFGVEVEFTGITREMAAKAVQEVVGGTISGPRRDAYYTRTIKDSQRRTWKVMRDSSISPKMNVGSANPDEYRVEFVTPPLKYEDIETLQNIIRKFKEIGGVPHSSCGIHIHIDGANHTATSLRRMVNFMLSRQEIIYEALNIGARKDRWCRPICKKLYDTMKKESNLTKDKAEQIWYSEANDNYWGGVNHKSPLPDTLPTPANSSATEKFPITFFNTPPVALLYIPFPALNTPDPRLNIGPATFARATADISDVISGASPPGRIFPALESDPIKSVPRAPAILDLLLSLSSPAFVLLLTFSPQHHEETGKGTTIYLLCLPSHYPRD